MNRKILIKDVKSFILSERVLYAYMGNKRFYVSVHAGPNIERYTVYADGQVKRFTRVSDAVKFFNTSQ